jgi:hypothetical protein
MGIRTTGGVGESGSPIAYGSAAAIVRIVRGGSSDLAAGMFFGMLGIPLLYVVVCRILDKRRTRYRDEGSEGR